MAGRIPREFITELLARVDLAQVIAPHVQLKQNGREYKACCPFHQEKTPSFTVVPDKGFYHCFGCGAHGTAISFLMDYTRCSFVDAVEDLARLAGMQVPREAGAQLRQEKREPLYECLNAANSYYKAMLRESDAAKTYAKERGLSGEICKEYQVGFAPAGYDSLEKHLAGKFDQDLLLKAGLLKKSEDRVYGRFRNRLVFAIRDSRGRIAGFGGRVIDDADKPKYLNSPETPVFHKGHILYGLYEIQQRRSKFEELVIVEGYMDVIGLAQAGATNAVATLGTATTEDHLRQMGRFCRKFVFCFDGDAAGQTAGWRALEHILPVLRDGDEVRFAHLPQQEDPDSYIRAHGLEVWQEFLAQSTPLEDYFFAHLSEGLNVESVSGRSKLVAKARPLLASMADSSFRDLMLSLLSEITGLGIAQLRVPSKESAPAPSAPKTAPAQSGRPPLMRKMIRMLLEYPELAVKASSSLLQHLEGLEMKGAEIFAEMVEVARSHPGINTGGLIEAVGMTQGEETTRHLHALLRWQPTGMKEVSAKERQQHFRKGLARLQDERLKAQMSRLNQMQMEGKRLNTRQQKQYEECVEQRRQLRRELIGGGTPR